MNNRLAQIVRTCNQFTISKSSWEELAGVCNMSGKRKQWKSLEDMGWQCTSCHFRNSPSTTHCESCDKRHKVKTEQHSPKITHSPKLFRSSKAQSSLPGVCQSVPKEIVRKKQINDARKYMEDITQFHLMNGGKFQDASFPHSAESLCFDAKKRGRNNRVAQWLSPVKFKYWKLLPWEKEESWEVIQDPEPTDITCQGIYWDCWLISAMALLAEQPIIVERLMITQDFNPQGAYQVRLCKDGEWIVVMVDDHLPCDKYQEVVYSQLKRKQLWVPLIEKAMAKAYGCYEALDGGLLREGLSMLSGSPVDYIVFQDSKSDEVWTRICDACCDGNIIAAECGRHFSPIDIPAEQFEKVGLLKSHHYSILDAKSFPGSPRLVCLRNPWGEASWNGPWSNDSDDWEMVTGRKMVIHEEEEGVFWMPLEDMMKYFSHISICMYEPDWCEIRRKVELPLNSKQEVDILGIQVTEQTEFVIELFQTSKRSSPKNWSPLDLCIVVVEGPRTWKEKVVVGKIASSSDRRTHSFVNTRVTLEPGNYLIAPLSFNKWQTRSTPVIGRFAIHASKRFEMGLPRASVETLAQIIIKVTMDKGKERLTKSGQGSLFRLIRNPGIIFVGENRSNKKYMRVKCEITIKSGRYVATRGRFLTLDVIPPRHRMVSVILSALDQGGNECSEENDFNLRNEDGLQDWYSKDPHAHHVPAITKDIEPLHRKFKID